MFVHFLTFKNKNIVGGVTVQNHVRRDFPWKYNLQWLFMKTLSPQTHLNVQSIQFWSWNLHLGVLTKVKYVPHDSRDAFLFVMFASLPVWVLLVWSLLLWICVISEASALRWSLLHPHLCLAGCCHWSWPTDLASQLDLRPASQPQPCKVTWAVDVLCLPFLGIVGQPPGQ